MGDRAALAYIEAALLPTVDLAVAVEDIAAVAVPPLADPAAVAAGLAVVVVAVRAEEAVALRIHLRHAVAVAEGLTGKVVRGILPA